MVESINNFVESELLPYFRRNPSTNGQRLAGTIKLMEMADAKMGNKISSSISPQRNEPEHRIQEKKKVHIYTYG